MDILLIEDDDLVAKTIIHCWPVPGDHIRLLSNYSRCLRTIHSGEIDVFDGAIVDIHLPDGNGLEILRTVRRHSAIPLILISGTGTAESRASALDAGADDYVMKPFSVRELQARLTRAVAKSVSMRFEIPRYALAIGSVNCDLTSRALTCGGKTVPLTDLEARLVSELNRNHGRVCSKSQLSKHACFREYDPRDKTLDVYISRLRRKIGELDSQSVEYVQTVRGVGYRLLTPMGISGTSKTPKST
ncbi:response regulator transcription factor [Bradyrhizobium sp. BRP14]|nr:response regulator transcription factor [Bradyrhizobium sp. BRP14]